jgi:hypothetical protein
MQSRDSVSGLTSRSGRRRSSSSDPRGVRASTHYHDRDGRAQAHAPPGAASEPDSRSRHMPGASLRPRAQHPATEVGREGRLVAHACPDLLGRTGQHGLRRDRPRDGRLGMQLHIAAEHGRLHARPPYHVIGHQQEALPLQPGAVPGDDRGQPLPRLGTKDTKVFRIGPPSCPSLLRGENHFSASGENRSVQVSRPRGP